jgi:hypothetical protein
VWLKTDAARRTFPLIGAVGLFTALSAFASAHATTQWVVRRVVPAGTPVTPGDLEAVASATSVKPLAGEVAAVTLVPGQTLVASDLRHGLGRSMVSVALPFDGGALVGIEPGDRVRLAAQSQNTVWFSAPVVVLGVSGGGISTPGTIRIAGPWAAIKAILTHPADRWAVVDETPS